jgi:hypothetical protein
MRTTDSPSRTDAGGARVVVVMGHRNRSGGGAGRGGEAELTPRLALAYRDALRSAGHEVHVLQEEDGDDDPTFTDGDLDDVARRVVAIVQNRSGDNWLLTDCHIDAGSRGGLAGIGPDSTGLTHTGGIDGAGDAMADNTRDFAFLRVLRDEWRRAGLPLRLTNVVEEGVMRETQTGVASNRGLRLTMMGWTKAIREQCIRVVVEHGDWALDNALILSPDFPPLAARCMVRAVEAIFGAPSAAVQRPPSGDGALPAAAPPSARANSAITSAAPSGGSESAFVTTSCSDPSR